MFTCVNCTSDTDNDDDWCDACVRESRIAALEHPECPTCIEYVGRMHPSHDASANCQSGKRPHCSCDVCF